MDLKHKFPFFKNNPGLIYFDNAATTQKPDSVLKVVNEYYKNFNANAGRGSYKLANDVAKKVEEARNKLRRFINAEFNEEIVFTSGATHSLNLVALSWGLNNLKDGDEILYCSLDHKSAVLPWFNLKKNLKKMGININLIPFGIRKTGDADINEIKSKISSKTRLIALTHISNIYGSDSDIADLTNYLQGNNILVSLDASQSIGHTQVDVQRLGIDFLSFSGHKMFALLGTGVLYINKNIFNEINPVFIGGGADEHFLIEEEYEMIKMPQRLEPGTQNYAGILSLAEAIDFIESLGIENIHSYLTRLTQYLLIELKKLNSIEFLNGLAFCNCYDGYGIVSFKHTKINSNDLGFILSEHNICVRTGSHCQSTQNDHNNSVRISLHIYNTEEEIDRLIQVLRGID